MSVTPVLSRLIWLLAAVRPAVGVKVAVQVVPPSLEATALSVPLATVRSVLSKPLTASPKVMVTSEVSPTVRLLSATTMEAGAMKLVSTVSARPTEAALILPAASAALAVSVCAPSLKIDEVMLQLPPVAVAVPSTVVPSVS